MAIDQEKFQELAQKMVGDMGVAFGAALVVVGDRLGLYKSLAEKGPATSEELASRTGTFERYVREWLAAQAAAGYISGDAAAKRYFLSEEQALVFASEDSPLFAPASFEIAAAMMRDEPKITEAFRSGRGVGWGEHDACLFRGTERFFRPGYATNLIASWLPALDGVVAKLEHGASVADVGCVTERRPFLWRRRIRNRNSSASISISHQSIAPRNWRAKPEFPTACVSKKPPRKTTPEATIWSHSSTACTTWAIRPAPPRTFFRA